MGGLFEQVKVFVRRDDLIETIVLFLQEHYELALIAAAVIFIFVLCLSTILQRLRKSSWIALVPVYRFVVLFKATGISPWCTILMLIPGVNLIMRLVFYVALVRKFNRNYFFVFLLVVLPLIFLPVVAFGDGHYIYVKKVKRPKEKKVKVARPTLKAKGTAAPAVSSVEQTEKKQISMEKAPQVQHEDTSCALSMAEIRQRKAKAHIDRLNAKIKAAPKPQSSHSQVDEIKQSTKVKTMMPEMGMGPRSRDINEQVKKARGAQNEYERLLKEQEAKQRRRQQMSQARRPVTSPTVKKAAANNAKTAVKRSSDIKMIKRPATAVAQKPAVTRRPIKSAVQVKRPVATKPKQSKANPHNIKINFG